MEIKLFHTLAAQKAVFNAPESERNEIFITEIKNPIRPAWKISATRFLGIPTDQPDFAMTVAQRFAFYTPNLEVPRALEAVLSRARQ
jgi:hypothetical protein